MCSLVPYTWADWMADEKKEQERLDRERRVLGIEEDQENT